MPVQCSFYILQIAHKHKVEHLVRNINLVTFVRSKLDSYLNHRLIPVPTRGVLINVIRRTDRAYCHVFIRFKGKENLLIVYTSEERKHNDTKLINLVP